MNPCACIGPAGDCPCIRAAKGLPTETLEVHVSKEVWDTLPIEDKIGINALKRKALGLYLSSNQKG